MLIAFHKPYGVLSQFTNDGSNNRTLADFGFPPRVYAIGRLDADSEGLLLLSDEAQWNQKLLKPGESHWRTYWVQVERIPSADKLEQLAAGVRIQDYQTRPCRVRLLEQSPAVPERNPPIRFRKNVPDCWLEMKLMEGKNRQVRRMTAAIGHPTLRLIRAAIGELPLGSLGPGEWRKLEPKEIAALL